MKAENIAWIEEVVKALKIQPTEMEALETMAGQKRSLKRAKGLGYGQGNFHQVWDATTLVGQAETFPLSDRLACPRGSPQRQHYGATRNPEQVNYGSLCHEGGLTVAYPSQSRLRACRCTVDAGRF